MKDEKNEEYVSGKGAMNNEISKDIVQSEIRNIGDIRKCTKEDEPKKIEGSSNYMSQVRHPIIERGERQVKTGETLARVQPPQRSEAQHCRGRRDQ